MTEKNVAEHAISVRSRRNLMEAMRGEAFAFAKYKLFARQARNNGDCELADLFDKTADQEYLGHFMEQAELLQLVGSDEQDVTNAIAGESFEVDNLYKQFAEEAREDGDEQVAHRFEEIRRDEAFHQLAFHEALIKIQTCQRIMRGATRRSAKAHDF
jgi:rubrerythrin